jgi:predicted nucleic acid-binding protein
LNGKRLECVVDASIGIKLFVEEPLSDRAEALFGQLAADLPARFYVPDLFFIECANILWKYVRRFGYSATNAEQDLIDLADLPIRSVTTAELMVEALGIALAYSITAYDAAYVALSQQVGAPVVTADETFVRRMATSPYLVRWLGEFELLPPP